MLEQNSSLFYLIYTFNEQYEIGSHVNITNNEKEHKGFKSSTIFFSTNTLEVRFLLYLKL